MHSKTAIPCKIMHSEDRKNCKVSDFVQFRTCEIPILCSLEIEKVQNKTVWHVENCKIRRFGMLKIAN